MAKVVFIEHNGSEHPVEAADGASLMQAAISNNVPGIDADCGGFAACATCHVYVDEAWLDRLPPMDEAEDSMLSVSSDRKHNSRLSCQITVSPALEGLQVRTPEFQF